MHNSKQNVIRETFNGFSIIKHSEVSSKGFALIELVVAIALLGLLGFAIIFAVNPVERAKVKRDEAIREDTQRVVQSIAEFYVSEGRLPWADDLGSNTPSPGLAWTLASSPEVGICGTSCEEGGELILEGKLSGGFNQSNAITGTQEDPLYVAKSKEPSDPVYVCYLPQSETVRRATGGLHRITPGTEIPPSGTPEECPLAVSWTGNDVCYACVTK